MGGGSVRLQEFVQQRLGSSTGYPDRVAQRLPYPLAQFRDARPAAARGRRQSAGTVTVVGTPEARTTPTRSATPRVCVATDIMRRVPLPAAPGPMPLTTTTSCASGPRTAAPRALAAFLKSCQHVRLQSGGPLTSLWPLLGLCQSSID